MLFDDLDLNFNFLIWNRRQKSAKICLFRKLLNISDATLDVITSNLMFSTHHLMFDVFANESDVKQSGC